MIAKMREMRMAYANMKKQGVGMRRKLTMYWISMALSVFAGFLLILSLLGVFSDSERRVGELLAVQQNGSVGALSTQTEQLTARCISMSEEIARGLDTSLNEHGLSFRELNNNPDVLLEIQKKLYAQLNVTMLVSRCSGAFAILDVTTNTSAQNAAVSRSGIYLRATNISAQSEPGQEFTYFRGIPEIARTEGIQLHNRWNLEFDSALLPGYEDRMGTAITRLADACFWSGKIPLQDTWESAILLCVPILDSSGRVCGLCGVEISELYFKLMYPGLSSSYGNIMTFIAPVDGGTILLDEAMMGNTDGSYLEASGSFEVKYGGSCNTYSAGSEKYVGVHQPVAMTDANGRKLNMVTLIPLSGVNRAAAQSRIRLAIVSISFLLLMVGLALFLSSRFVRPIAQSLKAIQTEEPLKGQGSGISEIDQLIAFVQSKTQSPNLGKEALPPGIAVLLSDFSERIETLTAAEPGNPSLLY